MLIAFGMCGVDGGGVDGDFYRAGFFRDVQSELAGGLIKAACMVEKPTWLIIKCGKVCSGSMV